MSDLEYHTNRAATERHLAETATNPKIAALHRELASLYEKLITPAQDTVADEAA